MWKTKSHKHQIEKHFSKVIIIIILWDRPSSMTESNTQKKPSGIFLFYFSLFRQRGSKNRYMSERRLASINCCADCSDKGIRDRWMLRPGSSCRSGWAQRLKWWGKEINHERKRFFFFFIILLKSKSYCTASSKRVAYFQGREATTFSGATDGEPHGAQTKNLHSLADKLATWGSFCQISRFLF